MNLTSKRRAVTHHFSVGGQEGYVTVRFYEDGQPGEVFIKMAKEGSTVSGLMDAFATAVALALQYGVPIDVLCGKFSHMRFEPSGWSGNARVGYAKSIMDYLFRWLRMRFLENESGNLFEMLPPRSASTPEADPGTALAKVVQMEDAPLCQHCGSLMAPNGSCWQCLTCGSANGCS
jgi:ribonucleoside-diphosphate reductase alpha chain